MRSISNEITFRSIMQKEGLVIDEPLPEQHSLQKWFKATIDKPLNRFSKDDLAIACRQQMFPSYIIPYCLSALTGDPVAGGQYEGELLLSLRATAASYWQTHKEEKDLLLSVIEDASKHLCADDVCRDVKQLKKKLIDISSN